MHTHVDVLTIAVNPVIILFSVPQTLHSSIYGGRGYTQVDSHYNLWLKHLSGSVSSLAGAVVHQCQGQFVVTRYSAVKIIIEMKQTHKPTKHLGLHLTHAEICSTM